MKHNQKIKTVLVIAAHPDDEVLGCAGTIAKHHQNGDICHVLFMSEGITSRDHKRNFSKRKKELKILQSQTKKVAALLGIQTITWQNYPDNRMDCIDFLDVVKVIENSIEKIKPDRIYTHHFGDLNIDHRITAKAVVTATRPIQNRMVPEVYAFEVLSSTEWNFSDPAAPFIPNYFVDISTTLDLKLKASKVYASELNSFPHPRSAEAVIALSKVRGAQAGIRAAEAFHLIRKIDV